MFDRFSCCLFVLGPCLLACGQPASDSGTPAGGMAPAAGSGGAFGGVGGVPPPADTGGATASGSAGSSGSGGGSAAGSGGTGGVAGTIGAGSGGEAGASGFGGEGGSGGASGSGGAATAGTGGQGDDAVVMSQGCGAGMAPKSDTHTIDVGGAERSYILAVPEDYDANRPYRLILSYHWLGGTARNVADGDYYGLLGMSNGSTIFAAPQGLENRWSDPGRTMTSGGSDIAFATALVEQLTSTLCIDESRIFAEGFSMGGSMSYAIACAMPDIVRGVVAHSGGPMSGCVQHDEPVAYFMTHGTEDDVCTYPEYGVPQLNDFAMLNGCMSRELPTPIGDAHECVDFEGCMPGYPARACIFVGPHTPSPPGGWVPEESWAFISQF